MKVLIADDDLTSRQILQATIDIWGYETVAVEDGLKVLQIMAEPNPPTLLMLDWEMPGLDGLSLCHHLSHQPQGPAPYIIMLTGRTDPEDVVSGLAAGANDFVSKPYHPEVLRARVNVAKRMLDMQDTLNKTLEKLDVLAHLDELTELNNRRAAIQLIEKEMARANREKTSLCIGICDIDHFKNVNDHHGHHVGDLVLKEVAQSLHDNLRSYDVIGRYGGEEFVFALIGNEAEARMILERTRRAIEQRSVPHNGNGVRVTMSFGAVIQGVDNEKADLSSLLECADQALYQSKKSGRNRLTLASELSATAHFG